VAGPGEVLRATESEPLDHRATHDGLVCADARPIDGYRRCVRSRNGRGWRPVFARIGDQARGRAQYCLAAVARHGENGERLGTITTVDEASQLAELQLPDGRAVAVEANLLVNETDRVIAPTLSLAEVMARA
jgi:hypothetical protein